MVKKTKNKTKNNVFDSSLVFIRDSGCQREASKSKCMTFIKCKHCAVPLEIKS